jgi:hypothetical protein
LREITKRDKIAEKPPDLAAKSMGGLLKFNRGKG